MFSECGEGVGEESMASDSAPISGSGGYAPVGFRSKALVGGQGDKDKVPRPCPPEPGEDFAQLLNWFLEPNN